VNVLVVAAHPDDDHPDHAAVARAVAGMMGTEALNAYRGALFEGVPYAEAFALAVG
jgi:hypothetical protein